MPSGQFRITVTPETIATDEEAHVKSDTIYLIQKCQLKTPDPPFVDNILFWPEIFSRRREDLYKNQLVGQRF